MNAIVKALPTVARLFLGLIFVVFGLNGFLHFLPMPPLSGPAGDFVSALAATGYMFPLIKGVEVAAGVMLLSGRLVPLALTLLAPIIVNIVAFHTVLAPAPALPALILALELYLAWTWRAAFKPMLAVSPRPSRVPAVAGRRPVGAV